jgi:hypothetical protein
MGTGGLAMGKSEKQIEQKLREEVKKRKGMALKFVSPGFAGVPDRLLLFKGGVAAFVELKAPGEKPRKLQTLRIKQIQALGFKAYVVDNTEMIGGILDEIQGT